MSLPLNRKTYSKLIQENLLWLLEQPRTIERDHIEQILRYSVQIYYGVESPPQEGFCTSSYLLHCTLEANHEGMHTAFRSNVQWMGHVSAQPSDPFDSSQPPSSQNAPTLPVHLGIDMAKGPDQSVLHEFTTGDPSLDSQLSGPGDKIYDPD